QAWFNRVVLSNRVLVWFGLISFPLYLWHWPLLSFARIIESETPTRGIRLAAVALAVLLAWLTYRLIEKPLRFGKQGSAKTIMLMVLMGAVGFAGYNDYKRDGLEFRTRLLEQQRAQFEWTLYSESICMRTYSDLAAMSARFCMQSQVGTPTVLLLGDSHSNHLYPGLAEAIGANTILANFSGVGGLPFIDAVVTFDGHKDAGVEITNYAFSFAEKSLSVHTVIIAARGPLYLSGVGFGTVDIHLAEILRLQGSPEISSSAEVYAIAMRQTLARLLAKGKKIIYVLDNPELGFDPKVCVDSRPLLLRSKIKTPCAVSRKEFDERNREYRELVFSVLKDFPTVQVFDAAAQLCDDNWCWAMKDGKMLYRDDDHLSIEGSRYLAKELVKLITP
ncbi:MAG: SGNH hydrolase domain-containing protein, partial [Gallionella sp.]